MLFWYFYILPSGIFEFLRWSVCSDMTRPAYVMSKYWRNSQWWGSFYMGPFLLKVFLKFSEKLNKLNTHIVLIQLSVILFQLKFNLNAVMMRMMKLGPWCYIVTIEYCGLEQWRDRKSILRAGTYTPILPAGNLYNVQCNTLLKEAHTHLSFYYKLATSTLHIYAAPTHT